MVWMRLLWLVEGLVWKHTLPPPPRLPHGFVRGQLYFIIPVGKKIASTPTLVARTRVAAAEEHNLLEMVQGVVIKGGFIENLNPATGELIQKVKVSTKSDVDAAVAAAKAAQLKWASVPLAQRAELVRLAVRHLGEKKDELAKLITQEMGKTLKESMEEVLDNCDKDEYCRLVMEANEPEVDGGSVIVRHPHGVVSICAPWNYPLEEIVLLAIPSLIAGNACVIKPSEVVPLSSGEAAKAFQKGLNDKFPGLVSLLQGDGEVGSYLVAHPGVDMCAFTGSTATGAKILKAASDALKPVVLECGGKDPMVVMADVRCAAARPCGLLARHPRLAPETPLGRRPLPHPALTKPPRCNFLGSIPALARRLTSTRPRRTPSISRWPTAGRCAARSSASTWRRPSPKPSSRRSSRTPRRTRRATASTRRRASARS